MSSRDAVAMRLAGSPAAYDSVGLENPVEQRLLQNFGHVASGFMAGSAGAKVAQALVSRGLPMLQGLGEAGAIFPEGAPLPTGDTSALKELGQLLSDSQKKYKMNEALANWHASNMDFPAVLKDKWSLLHNAAGN